MEVQIYRHLLLDLFILNWNQYLLTKADKLVKRIGLSSEELPDAISLPADGQYGPFKFINMCVTDSLLMALYRLYLKTDRVKSLFSCHEILRAAMVFLHARMYNEAKACWVFAQINLATNRIFKVTVTNDSLSIVPCFVVDARSEPKDHLNIFNEFVLATYHFDEDNIIAAIHQKTLIKTLSKFKHLGDVHALGINDYNPAAIIVEVDRRLDTAPPLTVCDEYDRIFELQCLLTTLKSSLDHVIVGLFLSDRWVLYDDLKPTFEDFNPGNADFKDDFVILVAGYVNIPNGESPNVPFGISEEGQCGTVVFNPAYDRPPNKKEHLD
nr:uncharacterized protein LOC129428903 isoform X1 [Misgurnus anguillicaudatus]